MKLKKLPIGQSSFKSIIDGNYLYADKTKDIYNLITSTQFNFLSRPRRFGKSLLISTLEEIFKGNKELFKNLWIYDSEYDWEDYLVLIFDFNGISHENPEILAKSLSENLIKKAHFHGVSISGVTVKEQFIDLVNKIYDRHGKDIVVFIDEYDKPIIGHLGAGDSRLEIAKSNRDLLKSFYGTIKEHSVISKLRFVLLTGVSKFSKAGVFSELNNLFDLTMDTKYATLLGITDEEIDIYMKDYLLEYAGETGLTYEQVRKEVKEYYNGYRFSKNIKTVYNPFSLVNFLAKKDKANYWFESGTPTFLVNLIKEQNYYLPQAESFDVRSSAFSSYELDYLDVTTLLFQTGYLTIKDYDVERDFYTLSYSNLEVKKSFIEVLFESFTHRRVTNLYTKIYDHLLSSNLETFISVMQSIFASITYDEGIRLNEAGFHVLFYMALSAGSVPARSQALNSNGRIDMLVEIKNKVYVFEFKCNQSAQKALNQIKNKKYHQQFLNTGREIYLVGINFDTKTRNLAEYLVEKG